ncbi:uncharacterized protein LOC123664413 [Melitaea cinxia]|uniref:uncharacterized protein LOC123664413 n=1 Tax=Melitaea cinxia TaxID=113334 RepID=UPI001E273000|nr:uncharacterized protein LOC123664413 [Melitaea cinxia]
MDPFEFDYKYYDFYLPNKLLSLHAAFTNGVVTGLSHFEVLHTQFIKNEVAIDFCINFPLVSFHSENYEINGDIYEIIPLLGKGNFEFEIHNLTLSGKMFLKKSDDERSILIENIFYPRFSIREIVSRVEFDKNIDDIANLIVKDLLAQYLTRFNQFIAKNYIQVFIDVINPFLRIFDSWRLLASVLYD